MDSIRGWLAIAPLAGAIARLSGRTGHICFLLERGLAIVAPHCAACGIAFDPPSRAGERFRVALQVFEAGADAELVSSTRMFVGSKVLLARAGAPLGPMLDRSITYVGARVMVVMPRYRDAGHIPILLCRACGENIGHHLSKASEASYGWDRLVEFRPKRLLARWAMRLMRRRDDFSKFQMRAVASPIDRRWIRAR
ncbi:MAG: hypothetical protein ACREQR_15690 [Candidatus Binataceae bacterium]